MVVQVFNSGIVSGPETLVMPALALFREPQKVVFLVETRRGRAGLDPVEYARGLGADVHTVEVRGRVDFGAIRRLRALLNRLAPRVVHAHDVKASTYSWLASRGAPWSRVSTHHGVEGRPDWITRAYEYFYSQVVLPQMNAVITVSRDDERTLLRRGLAPGKVQFVANGVTRKIWQGEEKARERERIRAQWNQELGGFGPDVPVIGIVARLSAEKRHSYFLRTLATLREQCPDLKWKFLAFGTGVLEKSLRAETDRLGLSPFCHWLGYRSDAAALLPGLDLLVLSSQAEGLPIVALEAGWAGVPMFATNVGSLPELVSTGRTAGGVIFPREQEPAHTAKSLAWILQHPRERERLGMRLQHRVEREYSAAAFVERTEAIYRTI